MHPALCTRNCQKRCAQRRILVADQFLSIASESKVSRSGAPYDRRGVKVHQCVRWKSCKFYWALFHSVRIITKFQATDFETTKLYLNSILATFDEVKLVSTWVYRIPIHVQRFTNFRAGFWSPNLTLSVRFGEICYIFAMSIPPLERSQYPTYRSILSSYLLKGDMWSFPGGFLASLCPCHINATSCLCGLASDSSLMPSEI